MAEKLTNNRLLEGVLSELRQKNEFDRPKSAPGVRAITDIEALVAPMNLDTLSFSAEPSYQHETRSILRFRKILEASAPREGRISDDRIIEGLVQELSAPNEHR